MNHKILLFLGILLSLNSCSTKIPSGQSETPISENINPVIKDSLHEIRSLCIDAFRECTSIRNGYYRGYLVEGENPSCKNYNQYATVNQSGSDVFVAKYSEFGRCIEDLQWPVDSVIKYLGIPYKIVPRFIPEKPEIQVGTRLFYCDKINGSEIDCSKADKNDFSRSVFVPKWD